MAKASGRDARHVPQPEEPLSPEEAVPKPSRLRRALKRVGFALLLAIALVFAYLFLLLGEPDDDAKYVSKPQEERIAMPMSAVEAPGEVNPQTLAGPFGQAVLSLGNALDMRMARVYDTAFEGGYARRVTLTYAFEDGATLTAESLRPTEAVKMLNPAKGGTLEGSSHYTLAGLNAARMDSEDTVCIFAQSDTAVYAILCPKAHAEELNTLLRFTTLILPEEDS